MRWFGSLIVPIVYLIICIIGLIAKPKSNFYFGYRTQKSMQNEKIWEYSNKYFFKTLLILDIVIDIPIMIVLAFFVQSTLALVLSSLGINFLILIVAIVIVEIKIKFFYKDNSN